RYRPGLLPGPTVRCPMLHPRSPADRAGGTRERAAGRGGRRRGRRGRARGGACRTTARRAGSGGAQVAAEAMPYHRHRRTECNTGRRDPGVAVEPLARPPARSRRRRCEPVGSRSARVRITSLRPTRTEVSPARVEYLIRPARVTDIERLVALSGGSVRANDGAGPMNSGDLLRQLVY